MIQWLTRPRRLRSNKKGIVSRSGATAKKTTIEKENRLSPRPNNHVVTAYKTRPDRKSTLPPSRYYGIRRACNLLDVLYTVLGESQYKQVMYTHIWRLNHQVNRQMDYRCTIVFQICGKEYSE